MAKISIVIDVLNATEVVKKKKGKFIGSIASVFMEEEDLKSKIEQVICTELINGMRKELDIKLLEEGISAKLHIEVER